MGLDILCSYDKIVKVAELMPHPLNPNIHTAEQVERLAKLIKAHGWRKPITVSKQSNFIIRGHCRLRAARKAGAMEAPVDYQDYKSEEKELADLVADNKISEYSYIDEDMADDIIGVLGSSGFDLELTGFDPGRFDDEKNKKSDIPIDLVQLPYIFKKAERDLIMRVLTNSDDTAAELVRLCRDFADKI